MAEPSRIPPDILIGTEQPGQRAASEEVHRLAFGGSLEAAVVALIRRSPQFIPDLSVVAQCGEEIVGHILFSYVQVKTEADALVAAVLLAPLAVHPQYAGLGIGSALIRTGIERLRAQGETLVLVRGHPTYYQRFGFQSAEQEGLLVAFPLPQEEYSVLRLSASSQARGTLVYPQLFRILGYPTL